LSGEEKGGWGVSARTKANRRAVARIWVGDRHRSPPTPPFFFSIGLAQLARRGRKALAFYTVWSWWLLGAYFATAATASVLALARGAPHPRRRVGLLGATAVALFHIALPSSVIVVAVTWLVLVPMLLRSDPATAALARAMFFEPTSYWQHGGNALLALGELSLNRIPAVPYLMSALGFYSSAFGVWAFAFYRATGRWLYPFLNARRRGAVLMYIGLYVSHWAFFGVALLLFRARDAAAAAVAARGKKRVAPHKRA
jgi:hypothetical protein